LKRVYAISKCGILKGVVKEGNGEECTPLQLAICWGSIVSSPAGYGAEFWQKMGFTAFWLEKPI